jgi:hypothetical protein
MSTLPDIFVTNASKLVGKLPDAGTALQHIYSQERAANRASEVGGRDVLGGTHDGAQLDAMKSSFEVDKENDSDQESRCARLCLY